MCNFSKDFFRSDFYLSIKVIMKLFIVSAAMIVLVTASAFSIALREKKHSTVIWARIVSKLKD